VRCGLGTERERNSGPRPVAGIPGATPFEELMLNRYVGVPPSESKTRR
jgi:rubredoxin